MGHAPPAKIQQGGGPQNAGRPSVVGPILLLRLLCLHLHAAGAETGLPTSVAPLLTHKQTLVRAFLEAAVKVVRPVQGHRKSKLKGA